MYIQNTCHQYWTFCFIIQTQFQSSNPEVTCMCLDVIGKYVSWIDINLIANDKFVEVRLSSLFYLFIGMEIYYYLNTFNR